MSTYFGCGLLNLIVAFLQGYAAEQKTLIVTLAMLGKFAISGAYAVIYLFSTEQFPTVIKNSGLGQQQNRVKFLHNNLINYTIIKYFQASVHSQPVSEEFFVHMLLNLVLPGSLYLFLFLELSVSYTFQGFTRFDTLCGIHSARYFITLRALMSLCSEMKLFGNF